MKLFKRFLSVLCAVCMIMAMSVPAFAAAPTDQQALLQQMWEMTPTEYTDVTQATTALNGSFLLRKTNIDGTNGVACGQFIADRESVLFNITRATGVSHFYIRLYSGEIGNDDVPVTAWSSDDIYTVGLPVATSKKIMGLALAGLLLFTSSCTAPPPASEIDADLNFLCSDTCAGRLPGTPGNEAAQDYIVKRFQEAGLEPLEGYGDYLIPYTQQVFDLNQQTLTATFADGSTKSFYGGTDFYPYLNKSKGFSGPVTTDPNDPDMEECVYLGNSRPVSLWHASW